MTRMIKKCSTKLSQNISTWNYILFTVSYQNTLLKPENPTQGHMTSRHKDVRYATKTSVMPQRHQLCHKDIIYFTKTLVVPPRHQLCHENINYATKTSIRPKDRVPRYQCHKDYDIWLGNYMTQPKGKNMKSSQFTWNQYTV